MRHNYRMTLAFDGTAYQGWQRQATTEQTVQAAVERAVSACIGQPAKVTGSGRTDAGVHAEAMAAHFLADRALSETEFLREVNACLPEDIRVCAAEEMPLSFHSRLHAKGKIYRYQIDLREKPGVFTRKYVCPCPNALDAEAMRAAAAYLVGTHDFSSFTMDKSKEKSKVRTIHWIRIEEKDGILLLRFHGDGFLYHMVRILAGTLIEVGDGRREASEIPEILAKRERRYAGFLAPASGLVLERVEY